MKNVNDRQDKVQELKQQVEKILAIAHIEAKFAREAGASQAEMQPALSLIRQAQRRWDWVAAANAVGFNSPLEAARILGAAINKAQQARLEISRVLAGWGITEPVPLPDISTKAKVHQYPGLQLEKLQQDKRDFLQKVVPEWDKAAQERQAKLSE